MPDQPDMIAQVGQMLDRIQHGQRLANGYSVTTSDDHTIVLASAVLAVAAEIRDLRNVLAAAMSEGANMKGEPISFLRIDTGA